MRTAFFETLMELAAEDENIFLVVGDLGFGVVEPFAEKYPKRFVNAGVAEQNMTGLAAGLALSGKTVFTYSIANFPTLRCLEQIRNDVCYHKANVNVVSVGGGFAYGSLGMTHHATEDLAVMRALPGMTVVAPGDPIETAKATKALAARPGPGYLRLGRVGEPNIHDPGISFEIGRMIRVRDGNDICLMTTGGMLETGVKVADQLKKEGLGIRVLSAHTLKPLDKEAIRLAAKECGALVTLEEHSLIGGLGSAVAEIMSEELENPSPLLKLGAPSEFATQAGSQDYLREKYGLSHDGVAKSIRYYLDRIRASKMGKK